MNNRTGTTQGRSLPARAALKRKRELPSPAAPDPPNASNQKNDELQTNHITEAEEPRGESSLNAPNLGEQKIEEVHNKRPSMYFNPINDDSQEDLSTVPQLISPQSYNSKS